MSSALRTLQTLGSTLGIAAQRVAIGPAGGRARVGLISGHGGGNLGDDLMPGLVNQTLPNASIMPFHESWHEKRLSHLRLSGQHYFDHVLLGGGTLISPFWFGKVQEAVRQGIEISSLGTGAGSCGFIQRDGVDLGAWAPLLRQFRHLGVRGPRSRSALEAVGVEHAEVVGDLAMLLTQDQATQVEERFTIAVNVALPESAAPNLDEWNRIQALEPVLKRACAGGAALRPYAMHPADVEPTRQLSQACGFTGEVPHLSSVNAFFDYVGGCELNVAVRLHGAVLGCCAGVPPLILGYRNKCLDFAESMNLADCHVGLSEADPEHVAAAAQEALISSPARRAQVLLAAQTLRQKLEAYIERVRARLDREAGRDSKEQATPVLSQADVGAELP